MLCSVYNALHGKQAAWARQGSYVGLPDVILEQLPFHTQSFRLSLSSKQRGEKRRCRGRATFFFSFFLMKCMGLLRSCLSRMKKKSFCFDFLVNWIRLVCMCPFPQPGYMWYDWTHDLLLSLVLLKV